MIHNISASKSRSKISHHIYDLDQSPNDPYYEPVKSTARMGDTNLVFQETPDIPDFHIQTTTLSVERSHDRNPSGQELL
jgi:hypothetical protein